MSGIEGDGTHFVARNARRVEQYPERGVPVAVADGDIVLFSPIPSAAHELLFRSVSRHEFYSVEIEFPPRSVEYEAALSFAVHGLFRSVDAAVSRVGSDGVERSARDPVL